MRQVSSNVTEAFLDRLISIGYAASIGDKLPHALRVCACFLARGSAEADNA